jgi:putative heme-binding domain-containing protein
VLAAGATDDRVSRTIRSGVPGTGMPRFNVELSPDTQVWEILAHLRMLTAGGAAVVNRGDPAKGARTFQTHCASCHWVNGKGGRLGPELSNIGSARSASALAAKVRMPGSAVVPGFQPVVLVMSDGRRVRGIKKNEDAFSIQIMDMTERLLGFARRDLREVVEERRSPMPASDVTRIGDADLEDLVGYLMTLRRPDAGVSAR